MKRKQWGLFRTLLFWVYCEVRATYTPEPYLHYCQNARASFGLPFREHPIYYQLGLLPLKKRGVRRG